MFKTEADPLALIRADLAIQLEDDVAELAESDAIRSNVRQSLDEVKQLSGLSIWKQRSDTLSKNLDHLDKSGHRAPQISLRLFACFRGQSAVISSDQSNSLASMP
jgi:hypothetical protein